MTASIQEPVTGQEQIPNFSDPLAALAQFYRALNSRDLELMKQNWDSSDEAVMDNPLGGIKRGWAEIGEIYRRLFASPKPYRFEFYDYTLRRYGEVYIAIGRERGRVETDEGLHIDLAIRTTLIFVGQMDAGGKFITMDRLKMLRSYLAISTPS
jgi:SnoaL-like domain